MNDKQRGSDSGVHADVATSTLSQATNKHSSETYQITHPAELAALDLPTQYTQRIEHAERQYAYHRNRHALLQKELQHSYMTVAVQCGWLTVGGWVAYRGYAYSDPVNSLLARYTTRPRLRRVTTPIAMLGVVMTTVTAYLLRDDVASMCIMRAARGDEEAQMTQASNEKLQAYTEGTALSRVPHNKQT